MKTLTSKRILEYIALKNQVTATDVARYTKLSKQAIHRQLNKLVAENMIHKIGRPPKVFYLLNDAKKIGNKNGISSDLEKIINDNFLIITPSGKMEMGLQGFIYWCQKQNIPLEKTAIEYKETLKKYKQYKKGDLIDGMYKMKHTFDEVFLDKVFYLDFYSIERFGKTKLGQLLLYAKQSQNQNLIQDLVEQIRPRIKTLITQFNIDAVGFIPPTVKREVQLMRELERQLNLAVPNISIVKVKTEITVPQKTLNKLDDRIDNAKKTIIVPDTRKYKTILLIDDALGSGATLNEVAKKIKDQKLSNIVIGLAITGSFSGFEVISEV